MERVQLHRNQGKPRDSVDMLQQGLSIKKIGCEEIQIPGQPVAEVKSKSCSTGQVKAVKHVCVPQRAERSFGCIGDHLSVPLLGSIIGHGSVLSVRSRLAAKVKRRYLGEWNPKHQGPEVGRFARKAAFGAKHPSDFGFRKRLS